MNADTGRAHGHAAPVPRAALLGRAVALLGILLSGGLALLGHAAVGAVRRDFAGRRDRWLVNLTTRLGPAFIKAAQLLATRADVLPPQMCAALGRLHDEVRPVPLPATAEQLSTIGLVFERGADGAVHPVASGSIACVYRAALADGRQVAVKLRRPGVSRVLAVDLELMRRGARLASRLPRMRDLPAVEITEQLSQAIHSQLDFAREARLLEELQGNLAGVGLLRVPAVHADFSGDGMLVMEFIEGLRRTEPSALGADVREQAVRSSLHGVYQMLFVDGLVHCDLHPGNLYFLPSGEVVLVDAGFTVRLDDETREKFAAFFLRMSLGEGEACARIVLSTATLAPHTDTDGFTGELAALVRANSGVAAADFDLVSFATSLFDIQRRHGLYAAPEFVFPLLSLLVLEGTVRAFAPQVDFQKEARPYLMKGLFARVFAAQGVAVPRVGDSVAAAADSGAERALL